jgi:hypothetical protein
LDRGLLSTRFKRVIGIDLFDGGFLLTGFIRVNGESGFIRVNDESDVSHLSGFTPVAGVSPLGSFIPSAGFIWLEHCFSVERLSVIFK